MHPFYQSNMWWDKWVGYKSDPCTQPTLRPNYQLGPQGDWVIVGPSMFPHAKEKRKKKKEKKQKKPHKHTYLEGKLRQHKSV